MIEIVSIVSIESLCLLIFSSGIVFPLTAAVALVIGAAMLLESWIYIFRSQGRAQQIMESCWSSYLGLFPLLLLL